jgi:hypothetical protein
MSSTNSNDGNNGKKLKGNLKKHKKPNILDPPESNRGNAETSGTDEKSLQSPIEVIDLSGSETVPVSHSTVPVPPNNLSAPRFAMPSNPNWFWMAPSSSFPLQLRTAWRQPFSLPANGNSANVGSFL